MTDIAIIMIPQGGRLRLFASKDLSSAIFLLIILVGSIMAGFSLQSSTIIPSNGSIYYQPEARVLFQDEFESGNFRAWNGTFTTAGNNATVTSTNPYEGRYHGRFQTNAIASGMTYAYTYADLSPAVSEVYARAYFYIVSGLPLDDNYDRFGLIAFEIGGNLQSTFRVYRSGNVDRFSIVGLTNTGSVQNSTDAVSPVEGRWYCLEFYIKVHNTTGEYRAWINGVERITITNVNTASYGSGVGRVRFGLTAIVNVQHYVEAYSDTAAISTRYIGLEYTFGVIGSVTDAPAIRNFYWLFGNQSISYRSLTPSEIAGYADVDLFDGLVVWTRQDCNYNATAIRQFAQTRVVISDVIDFCNMLYPSLSNSTEAVLIGNNGVTYLMDWGNFRKADKVWMMNETGGTNYLTTVIPSALDSFSNITVIAQRGSGGPNRVVLFHMNGATAKSGFYVMDLDATTPETEWTGIWHLFPAIKIVRDFPTGKYARWMASGQYWWNLTWVYNYIDSIVNENNDISQKWVIGQSVEGRDISAIVIGNGTRYAIIDGSIHGNEKTGTFACLRIAELLIEYYRSDSFWKSRLTEYTVIIIPVLNPDGYVHNTRENANGMDLNRQFPPKATTTEPEAWALRWLMGNYTPTVYIAIHEGYYWYPLDILYGNYEEDYANLTTSAISLAARAFAGLRHWGWFTEHNSSVWIGKVHGVWRAGENSMTIAYASWKYNASCMHLETFVWSSAWNAKKCLWGIDYYCAIIISFLQYIER